MKEQVATLARNGWQLSPEYAYMKILLAGRDTLEQRFADVDAKQIRRLMQESHGGDARHPHLKKILRIPDLPKSIVSLLEQAASCA